MLQNTSPAHEPKKQPRPKPSAKALATELANAHVLGSLPDQSLEYTMIDTVLALMIRHRLRIDHARVLAVVREAVAGPTLNTQTFVERCLVLFDDQQAPGDGKACPR